jgi:hypothetical protein
MNKLENILQDLNYTFDAVGNIMKIVDEVQQTQFFDNQTITQIEPYKYDALYRLITTTGRENCLLKVSTNADISKSASVPLNYKS